MRYVHAKNITKKMKTSAKRRCWQLLLLFALAASQNSFSQDFFGFWGERWNAFQQMPENDLRILHGRYIKDTIQVKEMKEAFLRYKDVVCQKSLYEGFDSASFLKEGHGGCALLVSPLQRHPDKNIRACRGVWSFPHCVLVDLVDKNGASQRKLLENLNRDAKKTWLDGEMLRLEEPRWYMGFVVSPRLHWDFFDKGKLLASMSSTRSFPDFFSYADVTSTLLDGHWDGKLQAGARLLGAMCALEKASRKNQAERSFSVLLYQKPTPKGQRYQDRPYSLELLEPADADAETLKLFNDFKSFVEALPNKTFKPYYTTDFRLMTGRFYRVTASKYGWLVEDYLTTH